MLRSRLRPFALLPSLLLRLGNERGLVSVLPLVLLLLLLEAVVLLHVLLNEEVELLLGKVAPPLRNNSD